MISVKRFAELVEVVAATMDTPMSHQGIDPADLKYSEESLLFATSDASAGIATSAPKNSAITR